MIEQIQLFIDKIFTTSIVVALLIFSTKEIIEWHRRRKQEKSKKRALAHALSRELKDNLESIELFFRIINFIAKHEESEDIRIKLHQLSHGYESCQIYADGDYLQMRLPVFKTVWYEKVLVDLASMDKKSSEIISTTYDNIYFLSEKRNMVASLMLGELSGFLQWATKLSIPILIDQQAKIEEVMKEAHLALTGKSISP